MTKVSLHFVVQCRLGIKYRELKPKLRWSVRNKSRHGLADNSLISRTTQNSRETRKWESLEGATKKVQLCRLLRGCLPRLLQQLSKLKHHRRLTWIFSGNNIEESSGWKPKNLNCVVCDETVISKKQIQKHFFSSKHKASVWSCTPKYRNPCGIYRGFTTKQFWEAHIKSHRHNKLFLSFKQRNTLQTTRISRIKSKIAFFKKCMIFLIYLTILDFHGIFVHSLGLMEKKSIRFRFCGSELGIIP